MSSKAVSINTVLEYVDKLDSDDQQYLSELLHKRLIDSKRAAIAKRATQAKENVRKGRCKTGSAKDLLADLNG
jgi:mRNA-degrading endonuclease RelE of RelBE toxin-antitoxin system